MDNQVYGVRATALLVKEETILLVKQGNQYKTIGGAVKVSETSEEAVVREVKEELGISVKVTDLAFVVENRFTANGLNFHNIEFHYFVEPLGEVPIKMVEANCSYPCEWISFDQLANRDIRPSFLKTELPNWSGQLKQISNMNGD
ncbi:NUDIX hydrolase [Streptococcus saliviloxodontae]|uniref:NUDIX hydrolase n=1 Tax=Streptococcus saliviloxodontae TaxID=1349416 RepID=UPI0030B83D5A